MNAKEQRYNAEIELTTAAMMLADGPKHASGGYISKDLANRMKALGEEVQAEADKLARTSHGVQVGTLGQPNRPAYLTVVE